MLHHPVVFLHGLLVLLAIKRSDVSVRTDLPRQVGAQHRVAGIH